MTWIRPCRIYYCPKFNLGLTYLLSFHFELPIASICNRFNINLNALSSLLKLYVICAVLTDHGSINLADEHCRGLDVVLAGNDYIGTLAYHILYIVVYLGWHWKESFVAVEANRDNWILLYVFDLRRQLGGYLSRNAFLAKGLGATLKEDWFSCHQVEFFVAWFAVKIVLSHRLLNLILLILHEIKYKIVDKKYIHTAVESSNIVSTF